MATSRNPYHEDDGSRLVRPSVVAMLDILGFAGMAKEATRTKTENAFLNRLYAALEQARVWLEMDKYIEGTGGKSIWSHLSKDLYALKAFTDNIVIGWPIRSDGESELGFAFDALSWFQFQMIDGGFFIRGAISIGDLYVDEVAVVGGGLIEAYEGESTLARDPRIVLTRSAMNAVKEHLNYYGARSGGGAHAPQNRELLRDADGQFFLSYLDNTVLTDEDAPGYEMLDDHKRRIVEKLKEHRSNPTIWSKYAWVAGYHNYFCDLHPGFFDDEHKIDVRQFEMSPSLIIDPRRKRKPFDRAKISGRRKETTKPPT
jgi:hypothetical protein